MRAIRNGLQGAGIPVENSKGEWGPGQEEINVRYADALDMADNHAILKNGVKEIAHGAGQGRHLHVEVELRPRRLVVARPRLAVGRGRQDAAVLRRRRPSSRHVAADALVRGRASSNTRATSPISSRPTSTPTSASRSAPSRRPRRCGAATTAPPASGCAARAAKAIRIECRIGGADLNPYLAFAALIAAGLAGIEEKLDARAAVLGRRLSRQGAARGAEDLARGDRAASTSPRCCARRSATRWSITMCTPRSGSSSNTTAASPTGS